MGIILPLAASPVADLTSEYALRSEITYELGVPFTLPLARLFGGEPEHMTAKWQTFRHIVLSGAVPRWVKEMAGVAVALTIGNVQVRTILEQSLEAQGVDDAWLDELYAKHLDPDLLPEDIQAVVTFARLATRCGFANIRNAVFLRDSAFSDDEINEIVAAINLFIRVSRSSAAWSMPTPSLQRTMRAG